MTHRRVTVNDCRSVGFCVKGVKAHCDLLGLDFRRLVKEGLPFEELEHYDDLAVRRSIEAAQKRIGE